MAVRQGTIKARGNVKTLTSLFTGDAITARRYTLQTTDKSGTIKAYHWGESGSGVIYYALDDDVTSEATALGFLAPGISEIDNIGDAAYVTFFHPDDDTLKVTLAEVS